MVESIILDPAVRAIVQLALLVALVDTVVGIGAAIARKTFDRDAVAQFLSNHVLGRVIPILGLTLLASGLTYALAGVQGVPLDLGALGTACWAAAWAGLAVYALETSKSLQGSLAKPVDG